MVTLEIDPRVRWDVLIPADQPVITPNERGIELPLGLAVVDPNTPGWVLDAGCALNGTVHQLGPMAPVVVHLTQHIRSEAINVTEQPVGYVSADLRRLSIFADHAFARTVCISTLEHVGLDNSTYGASVEACPKTVSRAIAELCRVTRDQLLITVPYSQPAMSCAQWRFIGQVELGCMVRMLAEAGFTVEARFYAKCDGGWYGGDPQPVEASPVGFPQSVNAICCLRGMR